MPRLFLVDAYALIFSSYYAFINRPMRNAEGLNTSPIFGFIKYVRDIIVRENPEQFEITALVANRNWEQLAAQAIEFDADCVVIGDQIFTDTLGANCTGVTSILVNAIDNHNIWLKLRHVAELPFIFAARKRRVNYEES